MNVRIHFSFEASVCVLYCAGPLVVSVCIQFALLQHNKMDST